MNTMMKSIPYMIGMGAFAFSIGMFIGADFETSIHAACIFITIVFGMALATYNIKGE